jgi:hypothetical protein
MGSPSKLSTAQQADAHDEADGIEQRVSRCRLGTIMARPA